MPRGQKNSVYIIEAVLTTMYLAAFLGLFVLVCPDGLIYFLDRTIIVSGRNGGGDFIYNFSKKVIFWEATFMDIY